MGNNIVRALLHLSTGILLFCSNIAMHLFRLHGAILPQKISKSSNTHTPPRSTWPCSAKICLFLFVLFCCFGHLSKKKQQTNIIYSINIYSTSLSRWIANLHFSMCFWYQTSFIILLTLTRRSLILVPSEFSPRFMRCGPGQLSAGVQDWTVIPPSLLLLTSPPFPPAAFYLYPPQTLYPHYIPPLPPLPPTKPIPVT